MRLAIVIQRFGKAVTGGAEMLAAELAHRFAERHEVSILTTTARSHESWANYYVPGEEKIDKLRVIRFPIARRKHPARFRWRSRHIFRLPHSREAEIKWLHAQGPETPELISFIEKNRENYDRFIFFSYRYYPSYYGLEASGKQGILIPTAEHDTTIYLPIFKDFLRTPYRTVCLTAEERKLINDVAGPPLDGERRVIGAGIDRPPDVSPEHFESQHHFAGRKYLLYVGRIIKNKGCDEMLRQTLEAFECKTGGEDWELVLIGPRDLEIPHHPRIIYLGRVDDATKFSAMAGAQALIMPSPYESLSLVTLEAMSVGTPVLLNGKCEVLKGHADRSGGGIAYTNDEEFFAGLEQLLNPETGKKKMGQNALSYIEKKYSWPSVMAQYEELFAETVVLDPA